MSNTLEQRRAETVKDITAQLYKGDMDGATDKALAVGLSDPEFERLRDSVQKAKQAVAAVERHERQRDEIEQARKMAEQALAALAEKKRAFLAELEAEAEKHRAILGAAKQADSERNAAMRALGGLTGNIPGLLAVLPEPFQKDHERREKAAADTQTAKAKAKERSRREREMQDIGAEIQRLRDEANRFIGPAPTAQQIENSIGKLTKQRELLAEELKASAND
jgi:chromosome segregation ATPase